MNSLNDPNNFGARPLGEQRYYGAERVGRGRWATLPNIGILWTNDADAVQLSWVPNADQDEANTLRITLHELARKGVPARQAFDGLVAAYDATVTSGDLRTLG